MPDNLSPTMLVQSFLRAAQDAGLPALVICRPDPSKETTYSIAMNHPELGNQMYNSLSRIDAAMTVDIARTLHTNGAPGETAVIGRDRACALCGSSDLWDALSEEAQQRHMIQATAVVDTVQRRVRKPGTPALTSV